MATQGGEGSFCPFLGISAPTSAGGGACTPGDASHLTAWWKVRRPTRPRLRSSDTVKAGRQPRPQTSEGRGQAAPAGECRVLGAADGRQALPGWTRRTGPFRTHRSLVGSLGFRWAAVRRSLISARLHQSGSVLGGWTTATGCVCRWVSCGRCFRNTPYWEGAQPSRRSGGLCAVSGRGSSGVLGPPLPLPSKGLWPSLTGVCST